MLIILLPVPLFPPRIRLPTRYNNMLYYSSIHLPPLLYRRRTLNPPPPKTLKMAENNSTSRRPTCPSCSRPVSFCLCARIGDPAVQNKVSVTILQHSLESKHPLNSAKIAKLGLENVSLVAVSDANFGARFVIRLIDSGSDMGHGGNGLESSDFDLVLGMKSTQKRKFEDIDGFGSDGEADMDGQADKEANFGNGSALERENECRNMEIHSALNGARLDEKDGVEHVLESNAEPIITATIGKYGVISDLDDIWIPRTGWRKRPNFEQILTSQGAVDSLSKGFVVKKFQKRQLKWKEELEEYKEFELLVPPGSLLLFPSDKALSVDDLKERDIEVKNLIVLDGTWAKAKRMYEENPWLKLLPHLRLELDKVSLFLGVRRQPKAGYLSTIESIVFALKAVGDCPEGLDNFLDVFESMVGDQRRFKEKKLGRGTPV